MKTFNYMAVVGSLLLALAPPVDKEKEQGASDEAKLRAERCTDWEHGYGECVKSGKPLLVWVSCGCGSVYDELADCMHCCVEEDFKGSDKPACHVMIPMGKSLYRCTTLGPKDVGAIRASVNYWLKWKASHCGPDCKCHKK